MYPTKCYCGADGRYHNYSNGVWGVTCGKRGCLNAPQTTTVGTTTPLTPPKGERMPDTDENWEHLAELYGKTIEAQKDEISRLKRKINKLEQRR